MLVKELGELLLSLPERFQKVEVHIADYSGDDAPNDHLRVDRVTTILVDPRGASVVVIG